MPDSSDQPTREWLTRDEAFIILRDALGLRSSRTLLRWADKGKVSSIRTPGGHRRFDRGDVERIAREGVAA